MNSERESKVNMFHSVTDLCDNNAAIVALVVAFATSYNIFKTTVTAIAQGMMDLSAQTGGHRVAKGTAKNTLAVMGSGIAGMVYAYATVTNNAVLKSAMKITKSKIRKALDDEVQGICMNIYNAANDNVVALADYGVTPALLTTYLNAINDYVAKAPTPKQAKNYKQMVEEQVATMVKDADALLTDVMDKLVVNFLSNGNAEFEGQYRQARKIINPGSFDTVLKILVVNEANDMPLRNAKVYRDAAGTFKRSTTKGFVTFKDIEEGPHSFVLKHKLFNDYFLNDVMIAHSEKKTVTVKMVPIAGSGGNTTIVREGTLNSPGQEPVDLDGVNGTPASMVTIEVLGPAGVRFGAAANATDPPEPVHYDKETGSITMTLDQFITLVGFGPGMNYLIAQNIGMEPTSYRLTFTNLEA